VKVFHKNTEDPGPGSEKTGTWTTISGNFEEAKFEGLKEMVRFKFSASSSWVLFRMLQPTWFDTAEIT
jgi:hypothetical protein